MAARVELTAWAHAGVESSNTGTSNTGPLLVKLLREQYKLTNKEAEIAVRLIQNERQAAIVEALDISPNTFKTHRRRIYEKMGIERQIDLVANGGMLWHRAIKEYGPN